MTKGELAKEYFEKGYNCAQSVALAFKDEMGLDETTVAKLASSFGGGVARMREICGAVSGGAFVIGMLKGYSDPKATVEKSKRIYCKFSRGMRLSYLQRIVARRSAYGRSRA